MRLCVLAGSSPSPPNIINAAGVGIVYTKYYSPLTGQYTLPSGVNIKALRRRWFARS